MFKLSTIFTICCLAFVSLPACGGSPDEQINGSKESKVEDDSSGGGESEQSSEEEIYISIDAGTELFVGSPIPLAGAGYAPSTEIEVWIYSTPELLTTAETNSFGAFSVEIIVPASTSEGSHTLSIEGTSLSGDTKVDEVPVTISVDTTPPVIGSASVSSSNVDLSGGPQTITVSFSASDVGSGVGVANFSLEGDGGFMKNIVIAGTGSSTPASLTSGTIQNGTWTATVEIPAGTPSQTVVLQFEGPARDLAFNYTDCPGECDPVIFDSFTIVGAGN